MTLLKVPAIKVGIGIDSTTDGPPWIVVRLDDADYSLTESMARQLAYRLIDAADDLHLLADGEAPVDTDLVIAKYGVLGPREEEKE